jgi:tetratricopeptide (TPR) repeat protein
MTMNSESEDQIIILGEILEELDPRASFDERQEHIQNMLARYLNLGTVVALIGAGASIPLGYPPWTKFAKHILEEARGCIKDEGRRNTIGKHIEYLDNGWGKELSAQVILGECERLWDEDIRQQPDAGSGKPPMSFRKSVEKLFKDLHDKFHENVEGLVTPEQKLDQKHNPYLALLKLPVRRFITTNYDLEIERALLLKGEVPHPWRDRIRGTASTDEIIEWSKKKSFSQKSKYCDELSKFPLARYDDNRGMVFHCHGRIDDIDSCIITEDDYQQWYLKDQPEYIPFRQTLDITLSSNPILIIGYGLGDIDLMRWLRMITANRSEDRVRNPLFCINYISEDAFAARWHNDVSLIEAECDALYLKYGLHVIPVYEHVTRRFTGEKTTLCHTLSDLAGRWKLWWNGLLLKPKFRTTPTRNFGDTGYYHYKIDFEKSKHPIPSIQEKLKVKLGHRLKLNDNKHPGLAVVVGDGGAGKSWSVQKYLIDKEDEYKKKRRKGEFIFWSSYYANDVLTGIDRLIEFLSRHRSSGPETEVELNEAAEDRFEKLIRLLREQKKKHMVIVFDGIEKLLRPDRVRTDGQSISPEVEKFFQIISGNYQNGKAAAKGKKSAGEQFSCNIILTTRLFPLDILPAYDINKSKEQNQEEQKAMRKEVEIIATRCWKEDLLGEGEYTTLEDEKVLLPGIGTFKNLYPGNSERREAKISSLCSLVNGHVFCVALIRGILEDYDPPGENNGRKKGRKVRLSPASKEEKLAELERHIAKTPIDRRIYRVIREAISHLDKVYYDGRGQIVQLFIERISLFMHPVRVEVARVCLQEAEDKIGLGRSNDTKLNQLLEDLLEDLVKKNLLQVVFLKIKQRPTDEAEWGYVVHPLVRNFVHQTLHKSLFTSLPSLQLAGITTMEVVDPGATDSGVLVTKSLFKRLCEDAARPYKLMKGKKIPSRLKEEDQRIYSDLCRGAFSILRSRFCANTVTRWGDYEEYLKLIVKLYDTAKTVAAEEVWTHHEPTRGGYEHTKSKAPAPLYADELAWVYNEIGLTSISMGHLLNAIPFREQGLEISRLIDNDRDGRYLFQAEFNLSTAYIFLGRLSYAMEYLKRAFVIGTRLRDEELISRTKAYLAFIKYLQGSLEEADKDFNDSYRGLKNNPRARGVFYCYHGELLLKLDKPDEAKEKIDRSRHIGEAEFYPDLIAYARLADANLLVKHGEYEKAQNEYSFVLKEAQRTRLRRLESGALSGMSRLSYKLNDSEAAKHRAIESLKISNEYALCLHQTIGLVVLGKALVKEGTQRDLGIACLKTARDMANSQGYFLRKNEAHQALQELKVE